MLTGMLFIKHVGFKFNPVVAVDIESLYYILCLLKCTRDKEETIQPSTSIGTSTLSKKMWWWKRWWGWRGRAPRRWWSAPGWPPARQAPEEWEHLRVRSEEWELLRTKSTVPVVDLLEQPLQDFRHFRVTFHLHYENLFSVNLMIFKQLPDLCQRRRFSWCPCQFSSSASCRQLELWFLHYSYWTLCCPSRGWCRKIFQVEMLCNCCCCELAMSVH